MVEIPTAILEAICAHGEAVYPQEGCGLLLGQVVDGRNVVSDFRPMLNAWPVEAEKGTRFQMDEGEWISAEIQAGNTNLNIIGIFHSHPDHAATPSAYDLDWAAYSSYSYLITEIRKGKATSSRSWRLDGERINFVEEDVIRGTITMSTIRIPTPLRQYVDGNSSIELHGATVDEALHDLTNRYPDVRTHLYDGDKLRNFVNIYLNQEDIRHLNGGATPLTDGDRLMIVPSIAGGIA